MKLLEGQDRSEWHINSPEQAEKDLCARLNGLFSNNIAKYNEGKRAKIKGVNDEKGTPFGGDILLNGDTNIEVKYCPKGRSARSTSIELKESAGYINVDSEGKVTFVASDASDPAVEKAVDMISNNLLNNAEFWSEIIRYAKTGKTQTVQLNKNCKLKPDPDTTNTVEAKYTYTANENANWISVFDSLCEKASMNTQYFAIVNENGQYIIEPKAKASKLFEITPMFIIRRSGAKLAASIVNSILDTYAKSTDSANALKLKLLNGEELKFAGIEGTDDYKNIDRSGLGDKFKLVKYKDRLYPVVAPAYDKVVRVADLVHNNEVLATVCKDNKIDRLHRFNSKGNEHKIRVLFQFRLELTKEAKAALEASTLKISKEPENDKSTIASVLNIDCDTNKSASKDAGNKTENESTTIKNINDAGNKTENESTTIKNINDSLDKEVAEAVEKLTGAK